MPLSACRQRAPRLQLVWLPIGASNAKTLPFAGSADQPTCCATEPAISSRSRRSDGWPHGTKPHSAGSVQSANFACSLGSWCIS